MENSTIVKATEKITENIDFAELVKQAYGEMGNVNIVIAGKTGVGKSTLINAVFGEDIVETGVGKPVTQSTKEFKSEKVPAVSLFDTKGFELGDYQQTLSELKEFIKQRKTANPAEHIHICWYCISDLGKRYEAEEIKFIQEIQDEIPVIAVFTQTISDNEFYNTVIQENYSTIQNSVQVLASEYCIRGQATVQPFGISELARKTYSLIPECSKKAFAAAQKVDRELKKQEVKKIISIATAAAAAAGATPIPFSDAFVLAPVQIGMLAKISSAMGLDLSEGFLSTLVGSAAGIIGATFAGRAIVSGLLKLIPGIGSIAGGSISAITAAGLTSAMGWAYYKAIDAIYAKGIRPEDIRANDLAELFKENLKEEQPDEQ